MGRQNYVSAETATLTEVCKIEGQSVQCLERRTFLDVVHFKASLLTLVPIKQTYICGMKGYVKRYCESCPARDSIELRPAPGSV